MSDFKGIPPAGGIAGDLKPRAWRMGIERIVKQLAGLTGTVSDRAILGKDLVSLGLAKVVGNKLYPKYASAIEFNPLPRTEYYSGNFEAVNTATGATETIAVVRGKIATYTGSFDAIDPDTGQTITVQVTNKLIAGNWEDDFDIIDTDSGATVRVVVINNRVAGVV